MLYILFPQYLNNDSGTFEITFLQPHNQKKEEVLAPGRKKISEKDSHWSRLDHVSITEQITAARGDKHYDRSCFLSTSMARGHQLP